MPVLNSFDIILPGFIHCDHIFGMDLTTRSRTTAPDASNDLDKRLIHKPDQMIKKAISFDH